MNKLTKVIVRYNVTDKELEKILVNCDTLNANGVLISPAYLPAIMRQKKKQNLKVKIGSVIDFPFGESLFKSKLNDVRDSIKMGVNGVTVMLPTMLLEGKNVKQFKKQSKKIGRIKRVETSISLSAMDLTSEQIKTAFKITERTKLNAVTFIFGDVGLEEFREKMAVINKYRGKKPIKILANVENVPAVQELIKDQVDGILTPFADEIGTELIKRFDIKSVKLK
jgi:deoxyribose-phosphate aldolase